MKTKTIKTESTFQEQVNEYAKTNQKLLAKMGLIMTPTLVFPTAKVSLLSRLAIKVLNRAGGKIDFNFTKA